jgi:hypothetical protein
MSRDVSHVRRAVRASALFVAVVCLAVPAVARAQAVRGTLLGNVSDTSSAAVPGATVTATDQGTNIASTTITNPDGLYTFPNLKDGIYRVEAELSGFKKVVRENVRVDVNTTVRIDFALEAGAITEVLTVSADPPPLQSDRSDTGRIIQGEQIAAMPLGFGRNFQGMIATVPGASRPFRPHSEFFNSQDSLSSNVNGQSRLANNVQIEGADNNHRTGLLTVLIPSAEALETVSVTTSNYDAEFGRAGGAVTNVTLKSGTNELKGSGFYFGNTEGTIATNPFVDRTLPKERQKADTAYHQGGFTLGGPIIRNRLFFFGDYIRTSDDLGRINRYTIPTMAMRNGDFSASSVPIYDPLTGDPATGAGRTAFPGNIIPAERISPIARRILANVPEPNIAGAPLGQVNYQDATVRQRRTDGFDVKVNYQLSPKDQIAVRYSFQRPTVAESGNYADGVFGGPYQGGFVGTGTNLTQSMAGNWTRTLSNTFVMDARVGVSTYHNEALHAGSGLDTATEVGIPGANLDTYTSGMTTINLQGYSVPTVGFVNSLPWNRGETTYTVAATLTKLWGNHTIKFGGDYRHNTDYLLQTQDQGGPRGFFTFNGGAAGSPSNSATTNNVGNSLAAFLLDRPSTAGRDLAVIDKPGTVNWSVFSFIHDKWQVSPKLTLDLGLRHEFYRPFVGITRQGGLSNYDPVTNQLLVSGYGDVPENLGVQQTWRNFNPRLGASYRLDDKQVLRAGYGASSIPFGDNTYAFNFPVKQNNQFNGANGFVGPSGVSMAAGFPAPVVAQIPSNGRIDVSADPRLRNGAYFYFPTDLKEGILHSWNVAYQREIGFDFTAEVAYVGNHGQDIIQRLDLNASYTLGAGNAGRPQFAPFGRTSSVTGFFPYHTDYHSMQVKVDRRFKNNFLITNSYTLGKGESYAGDDANGGISTPIDIERSWGRTANDRRHTFVSSFVYGLPFQKDGWLGAVANGWQISGIFTAQTGTALDITQDGALLNTPGNTQRPDMIAEPTIIGDVGGGRYWFERAAFAAPAANTFGNLTRAGSGLNGPGYVNLDASLVKKFGIGTRYGEFRVDAFNVTNSLHPNNPNTVFGSATFGQITGAFEPRLIRFGLRFVF